MSLLLLGLVASVVVGDLLYAFFAGRPMRAQR
jgi:hypothetical protein